MIQAKLRQLAVTSALLLTATAVASFSARADIINGGFESASLAGWQSIADASVVTGSFGTGPAGGTYQGLIEGGINSASTADLAAFLGINAGSLNALGNGITHGGSAIAQTFTATAGDVLTLDWNFITDEIPPSVFNDFAFWSLNSSLTSLATANGSALSPFGGILQTGQQKLSVVLPSTGTYTLALGVANVTDNTGIPQLLVDNVVVTSTPEPTSAALVGIALLLALTLRRRSSQGA